MIGVVRVIRTEPALHEQELGAPRLVVVVLGQRRRERVSLGFVLEVIGELGQDRGSPIGDAELLVQRCQGICPQSRGGTAKHPESVVRDGRCHVWVAVAIAADPASIAQEDRNLVDLEGVAHVRGARAARRAR